MFCVGDCISICSASKLFICKQPHLRSFLLQHKDLVRIVDGRTAKSIDVLKLSSFYNSVSSLLTKTKSYRFVASLAWKS
jgi:hypothetical protein